MRLAMHVDEYVRRFEVAVQDAALVGVFDSLADRGQVPGRFALGKGPSEISLANVVPSTYLMLKNGWPSTSPTSCTATTLG